jgi:hypothetical protein
MIVRDQKVSIARLKKILEDDGQIVPGSWDKHVAYFTGEDGRPLASAKDMTFIQAETLIAMLSNHIDIPF